MLTGKIHSFQSLGAVDGPGIRFVIFMQGCNLRCACCHNPDTWTVSGGVDCTTDQIFNMVLRYKEYFGETGGVTVSGGEPLLQASFVYELFKKCHDSGINTCLDTSGSVLNNGVKKLLTVTDRVLLDVKYTDNSKYKKFVGCELSAVLKFLKYLNSHAIPTTIRQVVIPTVNDSDENIKKLLQLKNLYSVIDKIELLPFKKLCQSKYDTLKIPFRFQYIPEPSEELMNSLNSLCNKT